MFAATGGVSTKRPTGQFIAVSPFLPLHTPSPILAPLYELLKSKLPQACPSRSLSPLNVLPRISSTGSLQETEITAFLSG